MNREFDYSNENFLLGHLRNGEPKAFEWLYRSCYRMISSMIRSNNGTESDARDVFHDAMLVLLRNLRRDDFQLTAKLCNYLYSVCRYNWLNKLKRRKKVTLEIDDPRKDWIPLEAEDVELRRSYEDRHQTISNLLANWENENCRKIILAFYFQKLSLKEIAINLKYSYDFIRTKKGRCIKQFEKMVREHPSFREH